MNRKKLMENNNLIALNMPIPALNSAVFQPLSRKIRKNSLQQRVKMLPKIDLMSGNFSCRINTIRPLLGTPHPIKLLCH